MSHHIGSQQARQTKGLTVSVVALLAIALSRCTAERQEEATAESADSSVVAHYTSCVPAPESLTVTSAVPASDYDLGYPRKTADQLAIRDMLRTRSYNVLDTLLLAYADSAWRDFRLEYRLLDAYDAFSVAAQSLEPLLDDFVSYLPDSPAPRFARAAYYIESARHARGTRWAHETSDDQFARMNQYFEKAGADIQEGYRLAPCSFLAYYLTMRATQAYGATEASRASLDEALAVYPYSFLLRSMHMYNLVPRWGGSYEAMEQFAREADGLWDRNPRLQSLHGFAHWDRGVVYWADRDTTSALLEHANALVFGDLWQFRLEMGKLNYRIDKYHEALSNLDRALAQRPVSVPSITRPHSATSSWPPASTRWMSACSDPVSSITPGFPSSRPKGCGELTALHRSSLTVCPRSRGTAAKLNHLNIVPLHTFGEGEGIMYFIMGFVSGESLSAKLT